MFVALGGVFEEAGMKDEDDIRTAIDNVRDSGNQYHGMTYEQGVSEALEWVLGDVDDDDFGYLPINRTI